MTNTEPNLLTKKQIARQCSVSERCIANWMRDGVVPYRKIGKLVRFDAAEVYAALKRYTIPARRR